MKIRYYNKGDLKMERALKLRNIGRNYYVTPFYCNFLDWFEKTNDKSNNRYKYFFSIKEDIHIHSNIDSSIFKIDKMDFYCTSSKYEKIFGYILSFVYLSIENLNRDFYLNFDKIVGSVRIMSLTLNKKDSDAIYNLRVLNNNGIIGLISGCPHIFNIYDVYSKNIKIFSIPFFIFNNYVEYEIMQYSKNYNKYKKYNFLINRLVKKIDMEIISEEF